MDTKLHNLKKLALSVLEKEGQKEMEEEARANSLMIESLILKVNVMSVKHKEEIIKESVKDTIREMRMKNPEEIAMIAKTTISAKIAGNNHMSITHLVVVEAEEKIAPKEDLMMNLIEITLQSENTIIDLDKKMIGKIEFNLEKMLILVITENM